MHCFGCSYTAVYDDSTWDISSLVEYSKGASPLVRPMDGMKTRVPARAFAPPPPIIRRRRGASWRAANGRQNTYVFMRKKQ